MTDTAVVVAAIGAVPATIAAIAAIVSASKTGTGNAVVTEIRDKMIQLEERLTNHIENRRVHRG